MAGVCDGRRLAGLGVFKPWLLARRPQLPFTVTAENAAWIGRVLGAVAGGIVAWPLNRVLWRRLSRVQSGVRFHGERLIPGRSADCCACRLLCAGRLRRAAVPDVRRFSATPKGFIPTRTKAICSSICSCPIRRRVGRTEEVMRAHRRNYGQQDSQKTPGIRHTVAISGQSILLAANAPNFGAMYVMLDDFHDRHGPGCRPMKLRRACKPNCRTK